MGGREGVSNIWDHLTRSRTPQPLTHEAHLAQAWHATLLQKDTFTHQSAIWHTSSASLEEGRLLLE